jgi:hypothetical protein
MRVVSRLNIDAVTIRGVASTTTQRPLDFTHLYRRLQQILRICSNLHEELHHVSRRTEPRKLNIEIANSQHT